MKIYRNYSEDSLASALKLVKNGTSVYKSAQLCGVPVQTVRDRVLGKIKLGTVKPGPKKLFSDQEESDLVQHVQTMSNLGWGYTRADFRKVIGDTAVYLGKKEEGFSVSKRYVDRFLIRFPELKYGKPKGLQMNRAKTASREVIDRYYSELDRILTKYDLHDKPGRIYNTDETNISPEHNPPKVLCTRGRQPQAITSPRSTTATLISCGNAVGAALPPFIVFKGTRMLPDLLQGATPGTEGRVTAKGWSNSLVFQDFLKNHFLKYVQRDEPSSKVLLLYDGHKSHYCASLIEWARDNNIILFVLPPHTSHILQPLDICVFGPFKRIYYSLCDKFMKENPGMVISRYNLCSLICRASQLAATPANIVSAFKKAGIYPFNRHAIPDELVAPASVFTSQAVVNPVRQSKSLDSFLSSKLPKVSGTNTRTKNTTDIEIGGKAITEDEIFEKITSQKAKTLVTPLKKSIVSSNTTTSKNKNNINNSNNNVSSHANVNGNQLGEGPSGIQQKHTKNVTSNPCPMETSDSEDSDLDEEEPCCVCNLFSPPGMKNRTSIHVVSWAQCTQCLHWCHLSFCVPEVSVRKDESFFCPHCKKPTKKTQSR